MKKIPDLYDGINWRTIPKSIYDELITNSNERGAISHRNDKGKFTTIEGEYVHPSFMYFSGDYNFYLNLKYVDHFDDLINAKVIFDEELNSISYQNIQPFYIEYSKGFNKGYSEFEDTLKNDNSLFKISNEHIAHKVYSRVINEKRGSFPMYLTCDFNQTDLEKKIRKEKGLKVLFKLNKESFFKSGFEGGEFYKAWELILNNPTVFEPIFKANVKNQTTPEPEPLDLSDTSAVEKPPFTNEFDSVPESKVIEYFTKNLVENKHLTKETLTAYLKQAFELKTPPKQKYSFENIKTKEKIVSIFYKYYKETADKPHGKQQKYLDLLKIYFSGFEKINIRNFSK